MIYIISNNNTETSITNKVFELLQETKVVKRLKFHGKHDATYADTLTQFMDLADHKIKLSAINNDKAWDRETSAEYRKLCNLSIWHQQLI